MTDNFFDNPLKTNNKEKELSPEAVEKIAETVLLHGEYANEGNNAVILQLPLEELKEQLPTESIKYLLPSEEGPNRVASKVLRFFEAGKISQETANQERARQIIEEQDKETRAKMAKVPRTYLHTDLQIKNPEVRQALRRFGVEIKGDKVGVMMMDYIEGADLMTYLFRKLLVVVPEEQTRHRAQIEHVKRQLEINPKTVTFEELHLAVKTFLSLESPRALDSDSQILRLDINNRKKVFEALQRYNIILDSEVYKKLELTLRILHENGLYHNDLHERNVMLELDEQGNILDVYLLDFDKASVRPNESLGGDKAILKTYQLLSQTPEEIRREKHGQEVESALSLTTKVKEKKSGTYGEAKKIIEEIIITEKRNQLEILYNDLKRSTELVTSDSWWQLVAGIVYELGKNQPDLFEKFKHKLPANRDQYLWNLLDRMSRYQEK
jgi:tRNA A-37 threonylcarbamoyl transferase component Bud32